MTNINEQLAKACELLSEDPDRGGVYIGTYDGQQRVMVSVDAVRRVADRHPQFDGQGPIEFLNKTGEWSEVPPPASELRAARATIHRKDRRPTVMTLSADEFTQENDRQPAHRLGIRAETHAIRKAFPEKLGRLYTAEDFTGGPIPDDEARAAGPSEDWAALAAAAPSPEEVRAVLARAEAAGELTPELSTTFMKRLGVLAAEVASAAARVTQ